MDLTGIGVLLIGIAFLVLAIYLARVLNSVENVMGGVEKTLDQLPNQIDGVLNETGNIMHESNNTLMDVNEKLGTLTPLFHIVGDIGETTRTFSSSLVDVTAAMKKKKKDEGLDETVEKNKRLGGLYGTTALGYYLFRKKKILAKNKETTPSSNIYQEGELRAKEIEGIKKEAMIEMK